MDIINFVITPIVGGVIGYITNWIAIKMLFKPHKEKFLFGIKIPFTPGLIPKERYLLSKKVGGTIGEHLLTGDVIIDTLTSDEFKSQIENAMDEVFAKIKQTDYTLDMLLDWAFREKKEKYILSVEDFIQSKIQELLKNDDFLTMTSTLVFNLVSNYVSEKLLVNTEEYDKTIAELISPEIQNHISEIIKLYTPNIVKALIAVLDNNDVDSFLRQFFSKTVRNGIGGFAGIFVNTDKMYDNILNMIKEYCSNKENYGYINASLSTFFSYCATKKITGLTKFIFPDDEKITIAPELKQLFDSLIYNREIKDTIADIALNLCITFLTELKKYCLKLKVNSVCNIIDDKLYYKLKGTILEKYEPFLSAYIDAFISTLNISQIVENRINKFEMDFAEEIILSVVKKELNAITWLGALLGFIIGLIPLIIR